MNKIVVMRGASGSGKTTLVEKMIRTSPKRTYNYHLSIDFHMHEGYPEKSILDCPYLYRQEYLPEASRQVFQEFIEIISYTLLDTTKEAIIYLDNLNLKYEDFRLFVEVARKLNYEVIIKEFPRVPSAILAERTRHGFSQAEIERQIADFEEISDLS